MSTALNGNAAKSQAPAALASPPNAFLHPAISADFLSVLGGSGFCRGEPERALRRPARRYNPRLSFPEPYFARGCV